MSDAKGTERGGRANPPVTTTTVGVATPDKAAREWKRTVPADRLEKKIKLTLERREKKSVKLLTFFLVILLGLMGFLLA